MGDAMNLIEVDWLVYGLYGLTEEEIGIVEGRNQSLFLS